MEIGARKLLPEKYCAKPSFGAPIGNTEQFRSYHSRVYCNVEPTSVTPFSAPVRERALHAIMVGMMRLESDDSFNEDPPRFPDDDSDLMSLG